MKAFRQNKVLGLAIGETSLMAAEVVTGGKRPETRQMAEFVYPAEVSPQTPAALGKALATFLREHDFTAKSAVIGIPARWSVVKPKDVPPADASTLADLLRLQAEGEFSSELKDLVFDYAADPQDKSVTSVLLIATAKKYIDGAMEMCEAARLSALAITPSVVALGAVTSEAVADDALVLTVGSGGAELIAQAGGVSRAIRHLRGPGPERSFVGELRRAVSTMPTRSKSRELVVWGESGFSDESLGTDLGIKVRSGDLPVLGVSTTTASANGDGRKYAAAVALALTAVGDREPVVDFLHSRLAPPKTGAIPRWAYWAAMGLVAFVALATWAYRDLNAQQNEVARLQAELDKQKPMITAAEQFVSKVTLAQAWHAGNPRYLSCLKDVSSAIPEDNVTYVTSVVVKGNTREKAATGTGGSSSGTSGSTGNPSAASMSTGAGILTGTLFGKTTDQEHAQTVLDRMRRMPQFSDVKPGGTTDVGRGKEVQYSITFTYTPPKSPAETAPPPPAAAAKK